MNTIPSQTKWQYSHKLLKACEVLTPDTVARDEQARGMMKAEPLIVAFDALAKYAENYKAEFDSDLATDGYLADYWLDSIKAIRKLLSGPGLKDNGVLEELYWQSLKYAGFTDEQGE
jgi:hypothetical protein